MSLLGQMPLTLTCWMAWASSPELDPRQVTHAVTGGRTVALCGMRTTCQGGPWPSGPTPWPTVMVRCHLCAGLVDREAR